MEWNRSETLALARPACAICGGEGMREKTRKTPAGPCNCVLRAVFRACYNRFRICVDQEKHMSQATLQRTTGKDSRQCWGRRNEEFVADFCLVGKRSLEAFEYRIFKFHFLLGANWKLCCRQLRLERGIFFHAVYRIQQKLGRVFRELLPYGLFPLDEYFGGTIHKALPEAYRNLTVMPLPRPPAKQKDEKRRVHLVPPIRRLA
jgi:hypothetical protein